MVTLQNMPYGQRVSVIYSTTLRALAVTGNVNNPSHQGKVNLMECDLSF